MDFAVRAIHWRQKAEEYRAAADQMRNPASRRTFLQLAESYDNLAERFERTGVALGSKPQSG